ncbi:unnamed protein product [Rhizopus stolonifer]
MCTYTLVFVFVPPTSYSDSYPYFLPYLITIAIALLSVGIWYYRVVYKDALSKSYNAEIRANGQQTLFDDVYQIEHDDGSVAEKNLEEYSSKT